MTRGRRRKRRADAAAQASQNLIGLQEAEAAAGWRIGQMQGRASWFQVIRQLMGSAFLF